MTRSAGRAVVATAACALALAAVIPSEAATAPAANWLQMGFNAQHTGDNPLETALRRANVGHLVRAFATPTLTGADPIVAGGVVYLGESGGGFVQAIDAVTGAHRWTANAGQQTSAPVFSKTRIWVGLNDPALVGMASGSGAVVATILAGDLVPNLSTANGVVYTGGGGNELAAVVAATGRVLWSVRLPGASTLQAPAVSLDGASLFVSSSGYVYRVSAATGAVVWRTFVDTCGESAVTVSGSSLFVSGCNVNALSAATGRMLWHSTQFGPTITAPAVANGLVVAGAQGNFPGLAAFDAVTGRTVWKIGEFVQNAPTIAGGVVYVDAEFDLDMVNSSTGALLGRVTPPSSTQFTGSPVPVDGRVYITTSNLVDFSTTLQAFGP